MRIRLALLGSIVTSLALCLSLGITPARSGANTGDSDDSAARKYFLNGSRLFSYHNFGGAVGQYDEAIATDPKFGMAYGNRAAARFNMGDYRGAIADVEAATKYCGNHPVLLSIKSMAIQQLRANPQAQLTAQQRAGRMNGSQMIIPSAILPFCIGQLKQEVRPSVSRSFQYPGTLSESPSSAVLIRPKLIKLDSRPAKQAPTSEGDSAEPGPSSRDYFRKGYDKFRDGHYNDAISFCTKCIEMEPSYADAYAYRGMALYHTGDYKAALEDLNVADALTPSNQQVKHYIELVRKARHVPQCL